MPDLHSPSATPASTLTERYQTTIPAEVRQALGLEPGQRILYEVRGETVVLRSDSGSLLDLEGILNSDTPAGTRDQERAAVVRHLADRARRRRDA